MNAPHSHATGRVYFQFMCGICGVLNLRDGPPPARDLLERMVAALDHRGPDGRGGYRDQQIALGHTRLAIIDLAGGTQPLSNETGEIWVVFNGEIFNYLELAKQLQAKGHRFSTRSDTEVIVHAYEEWGADCVERFNGQFAFAVWDRRERRLLLARDPVGIQPLYLVETPARLLFASEMKAIFQDQSVERSLAPAGLSQVFALWAPMAPDTALSGVTQLEPGSLLLVERSRMTHRSYFRPSFLSRTKAPREVNEPDLERLALELREHLEHATKLRMTRADVPVGVYLSGGLDSSVLGALVRRFHDGMLRTFSLRFTHADYDEGPFQALMVERLGTEHTEVQVDYRDIAEAFYDAVWFAETPMLRTAPAPLLLLSRLVRKSGYKVVLTGEGADEFLGGYDIFREAKARRFWARQPDSAFRPLILERLYPWLTRAPSQAKALQRAFFGRGLDHPDDPCFSHLPRWHSAQSLQRLFSAAMRERVTAHDPVATVRSRLPEGLECWEPLGQAQYLEIVTLLSGYLLSTQGDRMLMGSSVEGRFPFLDPQVIRFANALPPGAKLRVLDEKHVLKRAATELVPSAISHRPKQPYRAPDAQTFVQGDAPDYVAELMSPAALADAGVFDPEGVSRLMLKLRQHPTHMPSNADNMAVIGVLSTQLLHHFFVRGERLRVASPQPFQRWHDLVS